MAFHEYNQPLFSTGSLTDGLREYAKKIVKKIDEIPLDQFLALSDDEVAHYISAELAIDPIVLRLDQKVMEQEETEVDVRGYLNRAVFDDDGPALVRGSLIKISIPYTGRPELWEIRPSQYW